MKRFTGSLNKHAHQISVEGLLVVIATNLLLWSRDKQRVTQIKQGQKPTESLKETPPVSVLVAAWNEERNIRAHLDSFLGITYPEVELIICAGGSDETLAIARKYECASVIVLEQYPGEGKQHALARCYDQAKGEILYFTDADCLIDEIALENTLSPITREGEKAATGLSRPWDAQLGKFLPFYIWSADTVAGFNSPDYSGGLLGRNAAVTREALEKAGRLNFEAKTGTDYHLARRLMANGIKIRHVKNSVVPTIYPEKLGIYRRKQSRWLRNLLVYSEKFGAKEELRVTRKTIIIGLLMCAAPVLSLVSGIRIILAFWSLLVAHAVCSKIRYAGFTAGVYDLNIPLKNYTCLIPMTLIEFGIWAAPAFDLISKSRKERW